MDMLAALATDRNLVVLVAAVAVFISLLAPVLILSAMRHKARVELDHYGKFRGATAARSFVCPECLTRTYAPTHIKNRWCAKCQKSFPEQTRARIKKPPPWFTDDLKP
jgi:hypothetical protein